MSPANVSPADPLGATPIRELRLMRAYHPSAVNSLGSTHLKPEACAASQEADQVTDTTSSGETNCQSIRRSHSSRAWLPSVRTSRIARKALRPTVPSGFGREPLVLQSYLPNC